MARHDPGPRRSDSVDSYLRETRVIVVMLSVAVVNEALERRSRRRWSVLAQYVMLDFVRNARLVWTGTMELAGLMPSDAITTASIDAAARVVRDTPRLAAAVRELIADRERRQLLHDEVFRWVSHSDEVLGLGDGCRRRGRSSHSAHP